MVTLGEPRDWLGVGKRVHWALDTSNSSKHSWRAVVGQTGSMGGSAEWVTRPVTFLWIYNFCLKYEKGMSGFFLGFFPSLRKETLFLHFLAPFSTSAHPLLLSVSFYLSQLSTLVDHMEEWFKLQLLPRARDFDIVKFAFSITVYITGPRIKLN